MRSILAAPFLVLASTSMSQGKPDIAWLAGGHVPSVSAISYTPDGSMIASSGHFGDGIKLWSLAGGRMIRTLPGSSMNPFIFGPMLPIRFTPDGKFAIAIGEGSAIGVWSVQSGKLVRVIPQGGRSLDLSTDGQVIASANGANVRLIDFNTGSVIRTLAGSGTMNAVDISPDGSSVAAGDQLGNIRTWRTSDGQQQLFFSAHSSSINAISYSPNGVLIGSAAANGTATLWNAQSGLPAAQLVGHSQYVSSLVFSPDGNRVATAAWDDTVRTWQVPSGTPIAMLPTGQDVQCLAFHPSMNRLAVGMSRQVSELDGATLAHIQSTVEFTQTISAVAFSPDSSFIAAGSYDAKVSLYDSATGARITQIPTGAGVMAQAISPDASKIVVATNDQLVKVFRIKDGALLGTYPPGWYAYALAWSPDGQIVADGNLMNEVHLRRASDQVLLATLTGHTDTIKALAYTPDGTKLLSGSEDGTVRVWTSQGAFVRSLGPTGRIINSIDVSPDGQYVLAGTNNAMAFLWRISDGALIYSFSTGVGHVLGVKFASNGKVFYTASAVGGLNMNAAMTIWRTSDHVQLAGFSQEMGGTGSGQSGPQCIAVSPDGKWMAYGREDCTLGFAFNTLPNSPSTATVVQGTTLSGSTPDLKLEDEAYLVVGNDKRLVKGGPAVQIDFAVAVDTDLATSLAFTVTSSVTTSGPIQEVWLKNMVSSQWELVDSRAATTTDATARIVVQGDYRRFFGPMGQVGASLRYRGQAGAGSWNVRVDRASWLLGL